MRLDSLLPAAILVVAVGIAWIVGQVVRQVQKRRSERRRLLSELGFYPAAEVGGSLPQQVLDLGWHGGARHATVRDLFVASRSGARGYFFRLVESGQGGGGGGEAVAVVASDLELPRCVVLLWPAVGGPFAQLLAGLAGHALDWAGARDGMQRVDLESELGEGWHVLAMAADPEAARLRLEPAVLGSLTEGGQALGLMLGGNALAVRHLIGGRGDLDDDALRDLVDRAWSLYELLKR